MSPKQVATAVGISRRTVYRLIAAGELIASRVGAQWRVKPSDLDNFLRDRQNVAVTA